VTPFNRVNDQGESSSYEFDVVRVRVASPVGDISTATPVISWNHILETKTYRVTIRSLSTGSIVEQSDVDTLGLAVPNQYQTTVSLPIGRYQTTVMAIDQAGLFGTPSDPVSFQVRTAPVITAPGSVVTTPRPTVTWQGVNGALNYQLELFNLTDNVLVRSVSGIVGTSYTLPTDLTLGSYTVRVRAFNIFGDSSFFSADRVFGYSPVISVSAPSSRLPDNTPTFQINAVPSADRYELYVFEEFGNRAEVFRETNLRSTVFTRDIPLPIGRYRYYINAVNEAAAGSTSGEYVSRSGDFNLTITERPGVVNPPATTFLTRPEFSWTVPLGAGDVPVSDIWVNKIENGVGKVFLRANGVTGTTWTSNTDFGLGTYHVYIRTYSAVDPVTVSDYSFPKTVRVTTAPNPLGPTGRTDTTRPSLTWEGVLGARSYRVYLANLSSGGRVILDVSNINALSYTLAQPLVLGRYRYWVMANSAFGESSGWSLAKDFQVVAAPIVSGVSSSTFDTTPTFNWTSLSGFVNGNIPAGATSYDIRIDQVLPSSVVSNFRTATVTGTTYTVPDNLALPTNTTYRFYVRGRSADTQGDFSVKLEFFVGGRPNVNAVPTGSNQRPTLSWGTVDGASSYEIHLVNLADPSKIVSRVGGIILNSFTPATNIGTGAFRLWVRAFNSANGSPSLWSVPVDFIVADNSQILPMGIESNPWILTAASNVLENQLSEISVSMLPSRAGSARSIEQEWADAAPEVSPNADLEQSAGAAPAVPAAAEIPAETDAVLSGWSQEAWWDEAQPGQPNTAQPAVAVAVEPAGSKPEQKSAGLGLLGSLLGLASLRRRRRDEES
jgi:hypothetical protein